VQELSRDPRAPDLILRKIASTTVNRAVTFPTEPPKKEDPVDRLVNVLRATEKSQRRQILSALEQQNPDQAAKINQSLYRFEDLASLQDQQVQKVLSRVDSATLSTALFGADEAILNKIMANLSKRARASLQEELSFRKNVAPTQLRSAREMVIHAIAEADQETE
jgi:flagellar motor switch protein FliG